MQTASCQSFNPDQLIGTETSNLHKMSKFKPAISLKKMAIMRSIWKPKLADMSLAGPSSSTNEYSYSKKLEPLRIVGTGSVRRLMSTFRSNCARSSGRRSKAAGP